MRKTIGLTLIHTWRLKESQSLAVGSADFLSLLLLSRRVEDGAATNAEEEEDDERTEDDAQQLPPFHAEDQG